MPTFQRNRSIRSSRPRVNAPRGSLPSSRHTDWIFVGTVLLLTLLGLVMAYSTTFFWSQLKEGSPTAIFTKQMAFAGLGLFLFVIMSRLDYVYLQRNAIWIMAVCLIALLAVLVFGDDTLGARRTFLSGSIQPSEAVKIAVIVYAAAWLASRREQVPSVLNGLVPFGIIVGIVSYLIVVQPDISTTAVIVFIAMSMFFMAGASGAQIVLVVLIACGAFLILLAAFPYAIDRVNEFVKVWREPAKAGYHIQQALLTLGSGGLFGHGVGASYQKFGWLPAPHTDSVIAVLGDEMGLVGLMVTLALFIAFAWRGFHIAHRSDSHFGSFMAIGVVIWVMAQMLMNVLSIMALIPFTGVPLPFLSVGGSSLVSLLAACGILVSIARGSGLLRRQAEAELERAPRINPIGGQSIRASSTIRGRYGRSRPARANRAQQAEADDDAHNSVFVGRDVRFSGNLRRDGQRPARRSVASALRWRGRRNGA